MDARAYRLENLTELNVFEVDQQTTFDVKEPLLEGHTLLTRSRVVVGTDFSDASSTNASSKDRDWAPQWSQDLESKGFSKNVPTIWLLEGYPSIFVLFFLFSAARIFGVAPEL